MLMYVLLFCLNANMVKSLLCLVIEIKSDTSLAEAVQILAEHKILSAPVVDVDAPDDASWIDRYIGIVEFAGIVVWILHQVSNANRPFSCQGCTLFSDLYIASDSLQKVKI